MTCSNCRTLNPPGAAQCAICGRPLPAKPPGHRRVVSPYQGVHTPTGPDGRPIRAWLDFGPNPWVNVIVGASICLAFAASAIPAVVREHRRVPCTVSEPWIVLREDGPYVRFFVRDAEGRTLATQGTLDILLYGPQRATMAGVEAGLVGQYRMRLSWSHFRSVRVREVAPDGEEWVTVKLLAEVGPVDLSATGADAVGPVVRVGIRVTPSAGRPLEAYSAWLDLSRPASSPLGGVR